MTPYVVLPWTRVYVRPVVWRIHRERVNIFRRWSDNLLRLNECAAKERGTRHKKKTRKTPPPAQGKGKKKKCNHKKTGERSRVRDKREFRGPPMNRWVRASKHSTLDPDPTNIFRRSRISTTSSLSRKHTLSQALIAATRHDSSQRNPI